MSAPFASATLATSRHMGLLEQRGTMMNASTVAKLCGAVLGLGMLLSPAFGDDDRGRSIDDQWRYYCSHDHDPQYNSYCERYRDRDDNDGDHDRWSDDRWREFCRHHHDDRYNRRCERYREDGDDRWREFCRHHHDDQYDRQ